jgi:hypothetical protein
VFEMDTCVLRGIVKCDSFSCRERSVSSSKGRHSSKLWLVDETIVCDSCLNKKSPKSNRVRRAINSLIANAPESNFRASLALLNVCVRASFITQD